MIKIFLILKELFTGPLKNKTVILTTHRRSVLHFVSKAEISEIHGNFFNDPTPTDCITFPFREAELLGEIFVCPKVAMEYSSENAYAETTLYIIHAILHLIGYDDIDEKDEILMRKAEAE